MPICHAEIIENFEPHIRETGGTASGRFAAGELPFASARSTQELVATVQDTCHEVFMTPHKTLFNPQPRNKHPVTIKMGRDCKAKTEGPHGIL
jgi:hypothetical protein